MPPLSGRFSETNVGRTEPFKFVDSQLFLSQPNLTHVLGSPKTVRGERLSWGWDDRGCSSRCPGKASAAPRESSASRGSNLGGEGIRVRQGLEPLRRRGRLTGRVWCQRQGAGRHFPSPLSKRVGSDEGELLGWGPRRWADHHRPNPRERPETPLRPKANKHDALLPLGSARISGMMPGPRTRSCNAVEPKQRWATPPLRP